MIAPSIKGTDTQLFQVPFLHAYGKLAVHIKQAPTAEDCLFSDMESPNRTQGANCSIRLVETGICAPPTLVFLPVCIPERVNSLQATELWQKSQNPDKELRGLFNISKQALATVLSRHSSHYLLQRPPGEQTPPLILNLIQPSG